MKKSGILAIGALLAIAQTATAATLSVSPSSQAVTVGEMLTLNIMLDTQGAAVDAVDVYHLNYNPLMLELQDAQSGTPGVQVTPGTLFAQTVANSTDTTAGKIVFSQAAAGGTTYNGSGVLASVLFKSKANGTANVTFNYVSGSTTDSNVASNGSDVLTGVTNGAYTLSGGTDVILPPTITPTLPPPAPGEPHANSCMINDSGTFYLIFNGQRIGITNPGLLFSHGYDFSESVIANSADRQLPIGENLRPGDGALVKKPGDPTVFLVTGGVKRGFVSASVFGALGFKFSSVLTVTGPELDAVPLGDPFSDPNARHPYGVHINQDGTIYWIGGAFKHAYPSLEVYNSWNVDNNFTQVVPANAADRAIETGDVVTPRLLCRE